VDRIKEYQTKLTDFLTTRKADLLHKVAHERVLSDAIREELKAAVDSFQKTWQ